MAIITLTDVKKQFGPTLALDGIDLLVTAPRIFGIVGPDGAGKTTLLRILVGLLDFEATTATALGYDIRTQAPQLRRQLGYVPQTFSLYPDLTVQQNLEFFADIHGLSRPHFRQRATELLALAQLEHFTAFLASSLSGGMKQKLALICALLHEPQLLILDEPNNGVDVIARSDMWAILHQLQNVTIIMSTGYLDEAERCDEIAYLYKGRIRVHGSPETVKARFPWKLYRLLGDIPNRAIPLLHQAKWVKGIWSLAGNLSLATMLSRAEVQAQLTSLHLTHVTLEAMLPTLEIIFTELTEQAEKAITSGEEG
ncbi:MAG: ABC transporter ATP-binding protein [Candidatus Binatia bacterium]